MKIGKEKIVNTLKRLWEIRPKVSHETILCVSSLLVIFVIALCVRLLPLRWGMSLSEFDPFEQYRFTEKIVREGYLSWLDWRDYQRWYPWGAYTPKTNLPGLPLTAATFYMIISALGINVGLKDFCIFFPAVMGAIACIAMYFLGKEIGGKTVGLISALVLALSPTFITRTSLGFFDDESVGILGIILFFLFFLRAIDEKKPADSALTYGTLAGMSLGYICLSWGAALYPLGIVVLFSFLMIILRRYNERLLIAYSLTLGVGLFIACSFPRPGIGFLTSWPILAAGGVFLLLCLNEVTRRVRTSKWKIIYIATFLIALIGGFSVLSYLGYMGSVAGKFIAVLNPFGREGVPLVMSVQEHRMTSWSSLYYEFGITAIFMILGFFFAAGNLTNRNIFLILYGLTSIYFASSMVRIIVLASPAIGLLGGLGIIGLVKPFMTLAREPRLAPRKRAHAGFIGKEFSAVPVILCFLLLMANFAFPFPRIFRHAYSPTTLLSGSMPLVPDKPVREWVDALQWMKENLPPNAVVFSWWDYGYWITVEANRTSVADNNTFNTTQIALIGRIFVENETNALKLLSIFRNSSEESPFNKPPQYILVFAVIYDATRDSILRAYGGRWPSPDDQRDYPFAGFGDFGKWTWMLQIAAKSGEVTEKVEKLCENVGIQPEISVGDYIYEENMTRVPREKGGKFYNSLIYLLMEHARCRVVLSRHPEANVTDPADSPEHEFFKSHFELIYPKYGSELEQYYSYVPIIAIYKVHYENA